MDIFIREVDNRGVFDAYLDGKLLCRRSKTPLLTSARILRAQGVHDDTPLRMWHIGAIAPSLESTIGTAASLSVKDDGSGPRFTKFQIGASTDEVAASAEASE